ncbi:MAG: hypothetical protein ACRDTC_06780 [Pseudonocardiaceae bacterium]
MADTRGSRRLAVPSRRVGGMLWPMRMSFTPDQQGAFHARREEVLTDFVAWLAASDVTGADAGDARVALDWKWGYQDGRLGRWTVADLEEFLLEWCPRKLSVPPAECGGIPTSIRAFMTFLAARGLLAPGSAALSQLQRCCERNVSNFVTKMGDPANYGMAKGLFARAGGLEPGMDLDDEDAVAALMERMEGLEPEGDPDARITNLLAQLAESTRPEPPTLTVGPVPSPHPDERRESAAAAPALLQLQQLWEFCAAPGRQLTQKGNLRLADARHLVDALGTGDTPDAQIGDYQRTLRSVEDLPYLSWLMQLAIDARVLRRHRGRLVAVARWHELSPVQVLDRLVDAAVEAGLSRIVSRYFTVLENVHDFVDEGAGRLLAELLDWRAADKPLPIDELAELMVHGVTRAFSGLEDFHLVLVRRWVRNQLNRLRALGVVTLRDVQKVSNKWGEVTEEGGIAELTAAGVPVAVRIAEKLGIIVLTRPDPTTATARELVALMGRLQPPDWLADCRAWVAHHGADPAAREIVSVLNEAGTPAPIAFAVLTQLEELLGEHAVPAVETMLGGPYDSFALHWLVSAGALDPAGVEPERLLGVAIELLAVAYEVGGPEQLLDSLVAGHPDRDAQLVLMERLWRADHPRVAQLLEAIGGHHPDQRVAKAARKSLLRHRSWLAGRR